MSDLTPRQFLQVRDFLVANPGCNAAYVALRLSLPRELVEQAMRLAR